MNTAASRQSQECVLCKVPKADGNDLFCGPCQERQDAHKHTRNVNHAWHVWINQRQEVRRAEGQPTEMSLYEFMRAHEELGRLPHWLRKARLGTLPTKHRQCSRSPVVTLPTNRLICALGQDVTTCPILASLYASVAGQAEQHSYYADVTAEDGDDLAARTCVWHIFTESLTRQMDTSEGYIQDESDRVFWGNVYDSLAGADAGEWGC